MTNRSEVVELTCRLIENPSVTPDDAGCQALIAGVLEPLGFTIEHIRYGEVDNLWATRDCGGPLFIFAGHTDVVPAGPVGMWDSAPFVPRIRDDVLYGRGSADMKGSLAAMLVATRRFLEGNDGPSNLAFLLTSDEEGPAVDGTVKIVEMLESRGVTPGYCIVGEPSSTRVVGDVVRVGRRGSLNGQLEVTGVMGHVAYPELARNPIHDALGVLQQLTQRVWDTGNDAFGPTTLQISNIAAGTGAANVIPGTLSVDFNLRFCTQQTSGGLIAEIDELFATAGIDHHLSWTVSGEPFLTTRGKLLGSVISAVEHIQGITPACSTGGGTSDGRFIAPMGCELIELGPVNRTIHQANECVSIPELETLTDIFELSLTKLLGDNG